MYVCVLGCAQVLAFPVQMLVRFWMNHHLLDLIQRPCWRVVKGRSKSYIDKVLAGEAAISQKCAPARTFVTHVLTSMCTGC